MTTNARPITSDSAHWYDASGKPCHFVEKKDGSGLRPSTLKDAKKFGWYPSVTTVLKVIDKPALTTWKIEQGILAALTTPQRPGEDLDSFIKRVLSEDATAEAQAARDLGTQVHDAIEKACSDVPFDESYRVYVDPVMKELMKLGRVVASEKVVIGDGYGGMVDCMLENGDSIWVIDFKTCKTTPKKPYADQSMQLSAYAKALGFTGNLRIRTANIYISTTNPGEVLMLETENWNAAFEYGFKPLFNYWAWVNNYDPREL